MAKDVVAQVRTTTTGIGINFGTLTERTYLPVVARECQLSLHSAHEVGRTGIRHGNQFSLDK